VPPGRGIKATDHQHDAYPSQSQRDEDGRPGPSPHYHSAPQHDQGRVAEQQSPFNADVDQFQCMEVDQCAHAVAQHSGKSRLTQGALWHFAQRQSGAQAEQCKEW